MEKPNCDLHSCFGQLANSLCGTRAPDTAALLDTRNFLRFIGIDY